MIKSIRRFINSLQEKKTESYIAALVDDGLTLGENVSIQTPFFFDPSHCFLISIGDRCTFAPDVRLIAHDASMKRALGYTVIGQIRIGNDCFIGASAIVLANVEIGDNCIVGAGSVVTRSVPDNSVIAGNPAKVVGSTTDYLAKHKSASDEKGVFGREYQLHALNASRRDELIRATTSGRAYLK